MIKRIIKSKNERQNALVLAFLFVYPSASARCASAQDDNTDRKFAQDDYTDREFAQDDNIGDS